MKKQMSLSGVIAFVTLALALSSAAALANNFADTYGFSAKGIAMGNAMTAIVDDWSSLYYNIGGLGKTVHLRTTRTPEGGGDEIEEFFPNQIAINYFYTAPQFNLHLLNLPNGAKQRSYIPAIGDSPVPLSTDATKGLDFHAATVGMALDLFKVIKFPDIVSSARFGLAMAITDLGYATKANDIDLRTHDFMRYGREAEKMIIVTGIGMGYLEDIFGGGLGLNMSFHGKAEAHLSHLDIGPDKQYPIGQSKMDLQVAPAFVAGFYTNLKRVGGSHVNIHLALSYRQETFLKIYPFEVENITNTGGIDMLVELAVFDYYTPHYVSAGVAVDIDSWLTISAQADWELWSKFRVSAATLKAFDSLGKDALASGDMRSYKIPKFFDIVIPRVGLSAKVFDWLDLMAGYYYQPTFVPNNAVKGIFNFLDNNKHVVSVGVRIGLPRLDFLNGPADFIIGGQFQKLVYRKVTKTPDPHADIDQSDTLNPSYSYGGWNPTVTAELSLKI